MTAAVRELLKSFEALPAAEKHQAVLEILRRTSGGLEGDLPDGALLEAADELFRNLDADEERHAAS